MCEIDQRSISPDALFILADDKSSHATITLRFTLDLLNNAKGTLEVRNIDSLSLLLRQLSLSRPRC